MVVSHDVGERGNVHFRNKRPVGERLALQVLDRSYGRKLNTGQPRVLSVNTEDKRMTLAFDKKLYVKGEKIVGFELAGRDGIFHEAEAELQDSIIILTAPEVTLPMEVRYAWQPFTG